MYAGVVDLKWLLKVGPEQFKVGVACREGRLRAQATEGPSRGVVGDAERSADFETDLRAGSLGGGLRLHHNSNDQHVLLRNVNLKSTGVYRCEVSAEAPSFASAQREGRMEVVCHLPRSKPASPNLPSRRAGLLAAGAGVAVVLRRASAAAGSAATWVGHVLTAERDAGGRWGGGAVYRGSGQNPCIARGVARSKARPV
ncbi:CSON003659 protein [Gryllus bimaculatus]|nr:CSON003659 protein [Gryllus bimaculatus]